MYEKTTIIKTGNAVVEKELPNDKNAVDNNNNKNRISTAD